MLESVVENYDNIRTLITTEEYNLELLKKVDIDTIREFIKILKPFEDVTKLISGKTIRPLIQELMQALFNLLLYTYDFQVRSTSQFHQFYRVLMD